MEEPPQGLNIFIGSIKLLRWNFRSQKKFEIIVPAVRNIYRRFIPIFIKAPEGQTQSKWEQI